MADDDTAPLDELRAVAETLRGWYVAGAHELAGEIDTAVATLATCTLPSALAPADVERGEPMPPIYADVAGHIPALRRALTDKGDA